MEQQQQQQQQQQQLRNLRDFLLVYNRMTELCFQRCVPSLHHRALDAEEEACLHSCAGKLIHSNHRLMAAYVQLMPALVQRRMADYEAASAVPHATAEQLETSPSRSLPSGNLGKGGAG
ncbi:mitochondrial import inner membrane translocase subunit Tim10 B [Bos taurus]|uniref:Mitochondrial import inner membrane translocase subunit Tim10 B n=3 Tax=Bos TaxID=9903 RepID=T10B_BOVIN|nr:mitochondrial import inner membrane translocase subunit Tim10 B [Bos taurus]Q3SZW4.1 RecName: Full=Mitochondrial import inner membrane translocase subunit Tim10 B; AltName: Full=Mitochondrial import inner membrane translocase subunit Tim9 B; AltName: Full=TIMM10B; Short=Tim10b [Bos taurus]AAI02679.1 Fracture callus 1 homolog (rat) [Bos taurus]